MESYKELDVIKHVHAFNAEMDIYNVNLPNGRHYISYCGKKYDVKDIVTTFVEYKGIPLIRYCSNGVCVKLIKGDLMEIEGYLTRLPIFSGNYIATYSFDEATCKSYYNLLDLETNRLLLKKSIPYSLYSEGDEIIAYDKFYGEIKRINVETETIWSFSLESLAGSEHAPEERDSIEEVLGIAHGNLWFYTHFDRLVALDIKNGNVVKVFSYLEEDRCKGYEVNEGLGYVYFNRDKNLYCIGSDIFTIIDTKTCSIIERYNTREADLSGLGEYRRVFYPFLQGDYFTFVGQKEGEYGSCGWAGIYDYRARKLVWECEIVPEAERQKTGNQLVPGNHLYISGNKLYIKDIQDNLHIFEKDE